MQSEQNIQFVKARNTIRLFACFYVNSPKAFSLKTLDSLRNFTSQASEQAGRRGLEPLYWLLSQDIFKK